MFGSCFMKRFRALGFWVSVFRVLVFRVFVYGAPTSIPRCFNPYYKYPDRGTPKLWKLPLFYVSGTRQATRISLSRQSSGS